MQLCDLLCTTKKDVKTCLLPRGAPVATASDTSLYSIGAPSIECHAMFWAVNNSTFLDRSLRGLGSEGRTK